MSMTATFIKDLHWKGDAKLFRLEPPLGDAEYVAVSAVNAPFSGPETYIFKTDANGEVDNWGELDGSYRGGLSHAEALGNAGYSIAERVEPQ